MLSYNLHQNYPNPFHYSSTIMYEIPVECNVKIEIFNVLGKLIDTPINHAHLAGQYSIEINGEGLPGGIYFYTIRAGDYTMTRKMHVSTMK